MIHTYSMVHAAAGTAEAARAQAGSRVINGGAARGSLASSSKSLSKSGSKSKSYAASALMA
jgi:hypothetical protein